MRFITTLALALALTFAPAMAFGAARDVTAGLIQPNGEVQTILEITSAEATTSGNCFNLNGLGVSTTATELGIRDSAACDTPTKNQYVMLFDAKITNLIATPTLIGDTSYSCVLTIEVNAAATGVTLTTTVDLAVGTVVSQAQNFIVNAGDKLAVMFANGAGCGGTIKPSFNVVIEGQRL